MSRQQEAEAALVAAKAEAAQAEATMAERHKRFVMLNSTFKKKEDVLRERAEAAEREVADVRVQLSEVTSELSALKEVSDGDFKSSSECGYGLFADIWRSLDQDSL